MEPGAKGAEMMSNYYDMKAARNMIVSLLDNAIDKAATDPTRAMASIDEARKQLQQMFLWTHEAHLRSIPKVWERA